MAQPAPACTRGCTCGSSCQCGADCKCGPAASAVPAAACTRGCTCGPSCQCGAACKCAPAASAPATAACTRDCSCGASCKCGPDCKCPPASGAAAAAADDESAAHALSRKAALSHSMAGFAHVQDDWEPDSVSELLKSNEQWAAQTLQEDPHFFERLAHVQTPKFFWIGCSDSRVPSSQITGCLPGSIFTHRNVANLVYPTDFNLISALQYAVEALKIKHIIVCGHYSCGGVLASYNETSLPFVNNWITSIRGVIEKNKVELDKLPLDRRMDRLCELNVIEQVNRCATMSSVQNAWRNGQELEIYGLIYGLKDGILKNLKCTVRGLHQVPKSHKGLKD